MVAHTLGAPSKRNFCFLVAIGVCVAVTMLLLYKENLILRSSWNAYTVEYAQFEESPEDGFLRNKPFWWEWPAGEDVAFDSTVNDSQIFSDLQRRHPNIPFVFWHSMKDRKLQVSANCAQFPNLYRLEFNNGIWQSVFSSNGTFYVFGAYYDNRSTLPDGPVVRLLVMLNRIQPNLTMYCQFWYPPNLPPRISEMRKYLFLWNRHWGNFRQGELQAYLLTCPLPDDAVPAAVSLVEHPCDSAKTLLHVFNNRPPPGTPKRDFAVCVKGLDFPNQDLSARLVEWFELLRILGAHRVFLYDLEVHPKVSRVLRHYSLEREGHFVDVSALTLPAGQPTLRQLLNLYLRASHNNKQRNEVVPYNDCFYRNMYLYHYIVLLDIDEVIMPIRESSWKGLMNDVLLQQKRMGNRSYPSFNVRNVYFFDDMPSQPPPDIHPALHMLLHVYRSINFTGKGQYIKCFHSTDLVLGLHNHFPFACVSSYCESFHISTKDAQLQHYRKNCVPELSHKCGAMKKNVVEDPAILRYKDVLMERALLVMRELDII